MERCWVTSSDDQTPPFKTFKTSPEIIRLAVMLYVRYPVLLKNFEDLLHDRGIGIRRETVRFWWHRFGPVFEGEIRNRRIKVMSTSYWQWHIDEVFVKIDGERHHLWRAVDHEGEVCGKPLPSMPLPSITSIRSATSTHDRT